MLTAISGAYTRPLREGNFGVLGDLGVCPGGPNWPVAAALPSFAALPQPLILMFFVCLVQVAAGWRRRREKIQVRLGRCRAFYTRVVT